VDAGEGIGCAREEVFFEEFEDGEGGVEFAAEESAFESGLVLLAFFQREIGVGGAKRDGARVTGSAAGKTSKFFGRKIFEIGNSRRTGRDDFGGAGKQGPRWAAGGVGATKGAGKAPSWSAASSESGRNEGLDFSAGPRVGAFFCDPGAV